MVENNSHLREARFAVIPKVPALAPSLQDSPDVIRQAICESLYQQGVDPEAVPEGNLLKVERHTIAGYYINVQRRNLVTGEGREARFYQAYDGATSPYSVSRSESGVNFVYRGSLGRFAARIQRTLDEGAAAVEEAHTNGTQGAWWPETEERFRELGARQRSLDRSPFPEEGQELKAALRTEALGTAVGLLAGFVRVKLESKQARRQVTHDLAHVATGLAGLHFSELLVTSETAQEALLKCGIEFTEHGSRLTYPSAAVRRMLYPRISPQDLPNARIKCPAHATGGDPRFRRPTDLDYLVHASLNEAADRGIV